MVDDEVLRVWFCDQVLPLEAALMTYIRRNWRKHEDVVDLRQEIYERTLIGARREIPRNTASYVYKVARNHIINRSMRERIVSIDLVSDVDDIDHSADLFYTERQLDARDELRKAQAGLSLLPTRCREVVQLRKLEGLSTREAAERLGVSVNTIERQLTLGMRALSDYMLGGTGKIRRSQAKRWMDRA